MIDGTAKIAHVVATLGDVCFRQYQPEHVLAVIAGDLHELIENPALFLSRALPVSGPYDFQQLFPCRHADLSPHRAPPGLRPTGSMLLRQRRLVSSRSGESMRCWVLIVVEQCNLHWTVHSVALEQSVLHRLVRHDLAFRMDE